MLEQTPQKRSIPSVLLISAGLSGAFPPDPLRIGSNRELSLCFCVILRGGGGLLVTPENPGGFAKPRGHGRKLGGMFRILYILNLGKSAEKMCRRLAVGARVGENA